MLLYDVAYILNIVNEMLNHFQSGWYTNLQNIQHTMYKQNLKKTK